ncbi:hypothetical protein NKG95_22505 [Mesorhizobium sp. M1423]|uniref:hypothetical protein n=1 Tax=unclassified Mesorhizobium TaxID=325217 RepID=UPI00333C4242
MKRHVGISLNLAQDESTVLPVDQIGPMTTHLAGCRTATATLAASGVSWAKAVAMKAETTPQTGLADSSSRVSHGSGRYEARSTLSSVHSLPCLK